MPGLIISTLAQDHNAFEKKSSCTQTRANADSSRTKNKAIKTSGQEGPNTKVSLHQIKVTPPHQYKKAFHQMIIVFLVYRQDDSLTDSGSDSESRRNQHQVFLVIIVNKLFLQ